MADLVGEAYLKAMQSEAVTLKVGPQNEEIVVSKEMLMRKSETFAKLLSKPGLTELSLSHVGVAVSKLFVRWCYQVRPPRKAAGLVNGADESQEQVQGLDAPGLEARKQWKLLMMDLW